MALVIRVSGGNSETLLPLIVITVSTVSNSVMCDYARNYSQRDEMINE